MADTLRIKRRAAGGAAGAPASLAAAELAFNEQDDTLYYGKGNNAGAATSILAIGGPGAYQPKDATLAALAAFNTNGLLVQTAGDTFAGRFIAGAAAGIGVINGDGVGGNPTLVLTNDLAALEGISGTGIYYRSAADTWSLVTIGSGLTFSGGVLSATGGGTGNVSNVGTPLNNQVGVWTGATTIKGDANLTWGSNILNVGPTGMNGIRFMPQVSGNAQCLIDTAGPDANITLGFSTKGTGQYTFYYNSFTSLFATLNSTRFGMIGALTCGTYTSWLGYGLEVVATSAANSLFVQALFSNDANYPIHFLDKSRGASLNTYAAVQVNDFLGSIQFRGSDATAMRNGGGIYCIVTGTPTTSGIPCRMQIHAMSPSGTGIAGIYVHGDGKGCDILGATNGGVPGTGYVGEVVQTSLAGPVGFGPNVWSQAAAISLQPGEWMLWFEIRAGPGGFQASTFSNWNISDTPASSSGYLFQSYYAGGGGDLYGVVGPAHVRSSVTKTFYLNCALNLVTSAGFFTAASARRVK